MASLGSCFGRFAIVSIVIVFAAIARKAGAQDAFPLNVFKTLRSASGYAAEPVVAKAVFALLWNYIWVFAPPLIALTAGASAVIIRTAALPKWTGWAGLLTAVTMLMPWIGLLVFLVWVLLLSVVLSVQSRRPVQTASS